jgi:hypothetical protein
MKCDRQPGFTPMDTVTWISGFPVYGCGKQTTVNIKS